MFKFKVGDLITAKFNGESESFIIDRVTATEETSKLAHYKLECVISNTITKGAACMMPKLVVEEEYSKLNSFNKLWELLYGL